MNQRILTASLAYIDTWLPFKYEREEIPGFSVAILHKGKVVFNKSYGFASLETKEKLTPEHVFRVASHSKVFTATAIMQLQEQGRLKLDDRVIDFVTWLRSHTDKRWQHVTIRQLLSHGAGMIRDGKNADYWQLERPFPNAAQLKSEIMQAELVIDNNLKHKYSNLGYAILGDVIESASGMHFNKYIQKNIIDRLQLTHTGPEFSESAGLITTGYTRKDIHKKRLPIDHVDTRAMSPATGVYSTASDMCTFFHALLPGTSDLISEESKKEMQRVHFHCVALDDERSDDYGLGIGIEDLNGRKMISHGGGFPGYITKTIADPTNEVVVSVLTNCLGGPAKAINTGIFSIIEYFKNNYKSAKPTHDATQLAGRYLSLWAMADIVIIGDNIVAAYPDSWQPFRAPDKLEYVQPATLKISKASSFGSEGELVTFTMKANSVAFMNYAGMTMWPVQVWERKLQVKKVISLKT